MIDLENTVDIHEASRLIGKSEKQVRRYIRQELLPAQLVGKQYFIKRDDIQVFIQKYVQRVPNVDTLSTQAVEELKQLVVNLEALVVSLEQRVTALEKGQVIPKVTQRSVSTQRTKSTPIGTRAPLPDGWVAWGPFINRHGVDSERRPIMALRGGDYCQPGEYMQVGEKSAQVVKCALDPDGQRRLLEKLWSMEVLAQGLSRCEVEVCPCHAIIIK